MESTDKSTPTYITPLRRSLGLSRRLRTSANSPVTPSITTPLRACNYNSPSIIKHSNNENFNKTPELNCTPYVTKCQMSPLKSETTNRTLSSKRSFRLSLNKSKIQEIPPIKKKRLDFLKDGNTSDDDIDHNLELLPKISSSLNHQISLNTNIKENDDDCISSSQMVSFELLTQIPDSSLELNDELANELKEIELLKQKQYRRRLSYGLKVREDKLKDIAELNSNIQLKESCNQIEPSQSVRFQTARQEIETISVSTTKQIIYDREILEIKNLIKIWRRGLRDAVEYLSCLSYPPTDIQTILRHHNISPELLIDR